MPETEREPAQPHLLGRWYAAPLDDSEARTLRYGLSCCTCRLLRLVARFWLDGEAETAYRSAETACSHSAHGHALTHLIRGQLLASRRRSGAAEHLQAGFQAATGLLAPGDYFAVVERHAMLRRLPPAEASVSPATLDELLTAAAVAARLERHTRHAPAGDRADIHG
jgi:hypothetical protein